MPIFYYVNPDRRVVLTKWLGSVDGGDLNSHFRNMLSDPYARKCAKTLIDLRDCTLQISGEDMRHAVQSIIVPAVGEGNWRSAILTPSPAGAGISQLFSAYGERFAIVAMFNDLHEALNWLSGDR
jgi:hypothetical protein